jgi:hypothetical protein
MWVPDSWQSRLGQDGGAPEHRFVEHRFVERLKRAVE